MEDNSKNIYPDYTSKFSDIIIAEQTYLKKRRKVNNITEEEAKGKWGICFSSGGVRGSIVSLGFIRALMKQGFFRRFDYMSTVSSGSFVTSCLSSLLTGSKSANGKFGVDAENSPFLPKQDGSQNHNNELPTAEEQMMHLKRVRGFISDSTVSGTNFNSLIGTWLGGWIFNSIVFFGILFFLASSIIAFLSGVSDEQFVNDFMLSYYTEELKVGGILPGIQVYIDNLLLAFQNIKNSVNAESLKVLLFLFVQGVAFSVFHSEYLRHSLNDNLHTSLINKKAKRYILIGGIFIYAVIFVVGLFRGYDLLQGLGVFPIFDYWLVFVFPISLATGMLVGTYIMSVIYYQLKLRSLNVEELKAAISGVKGSNIILWIAMIVLPLLTLVFLLLGGVTVVALATFLFLAGVYWTYSKSKIGLGTPAKAPKGRVYSWGSNFLAILVMCFYFSGLTRLLIFFIEKNTWFVYYCFLISTALMIFLFFFSQANRSNLHNLLKLKVYSAFLVTEGRKPNGQLGNLRNDIMMKVQDLGDDNFSGPYHIINSAVNVHKSIEADRRRRRAYPFEFAKYYCGSEVTNYAKTDIYQAGRTKLQDAITNSAAIVHSGMGIYNFWAQSFLITCLNLRLGGWIHNPIYYQQGLPKRHINHSFRNLIKEFLGLFDERSRYVNVSDGIHSGDNYGLIPLIRRQVENIVICDFSDIKQYLSSENSLEQTLTLARNYGIERIEMDFSELTVYEHKETSGLFCEDCSRMGKIIYKNGRESNVFYLRTMMTDNAPKELFDYQAKFKEFPFESLTWTNFDATKFDAYLLLGEFLGQEFGVIQAEHQKMVEKKELEDLLDERITVIEKDLGEESPIAPKAEATVAEITAFNKRLEKLINVIIELIIVSQENENPEKATSIKDSRDVLIEKLGYLRLERAKLAGGSAKFQISKELEDTERELKALEAQMKDSKNNETTSKLLNLKSELAQILSEFEEVKKRREDKEID